MSMNRSTYRYVARRDAVDDGHRRTVELSERYSCWGYRKIHDLLRGDGIRIGRERVRLIRRREGLQILRKPPKRRVLGTTTQWVYRARYPGHVWAYDFVHDQTADGRRLKCLTVVDEFTRQGLAIRIGRSLTATDVVQILDELFHQHGRPACIRSDNGPELVATAVQQWLEDHDVDTHYIDPGSPWQNAYNESFNSIFRTTCLDRWWFHSLAEARVVADQWLDEYNTVRPHGSLRGMTPATFLQQWMATNTDQQPTTLSA